MGVASRSEDGDPCNAIILPSNHKSKHKDKIKVAKDRKKILLLSKKQQRKLRRLQEEKVKRERRATDLDILEKHKIQDDAHALLGSSGNLGQVETMREKLSRAMRLHRAGLLVPSDVPLFRERETDSNLMETKNSTDDSLPVKYNPNKNIRDAGKIQPKKRKRTALHTIVDGDRNDTFEDASMTATIDNQFKAKDMVTIQGHNIGQSDISINSCAEPVLSDSRNGYFSGAELENSQPSNKQGLLAAAKSIQLNTSSKSLTCLDSVDPIVQGGSARIKCEDGSSGWKVGVNKSFELTKEIKYQVSEEERVKLDAQDSGRASKDLGWNPTSNSFVVHVTRPEEVEETRKNLPIVMMEQEIMEAINQHPVVIICGETGCGKTTQVPQFLLEAGFGSSKCKARTGIIGVTQPRRVAVLATSKRVAYEMSFQLGKEVGFQVRHDRRIGGNSSIKFMTDGILLREVQSDFLLRSYSVIVLDEAHERSLNTDILIGILSRIVPLRQNLYDEQQKKISSGEIVSPENLVNPLKLVLMSATLRVEDFVSNTKLFPVIPPVIEVPTRQFPVTVHFSAKTELDNYLGEAYKKVLAIHKKLPPGGILVFVTGQREVEFLCRKLRKAFGKRIKSNAKPVGIPQMTRSISDVDNFANQSDMEEIAEAVDTADENEISNGGFNRFNTYDDDGFDDKLQENSESSEIEFDSDSESEEEFLNDENDHLDKTLQNTSLLREPGCVESLKAAFEALNGGDKSKKTNAKSNQHNLSDAHNKEHADQNSAGNLKEPGPLYVLPLYAMLSAEAQLRVFAGVPEGERLVVVATNVAETSLTIPGIKYVVDTGRAKFKEYSCSSGIAKYEIQWISKASAAQRAGRAGRTGPGRCYRLYSSAVFNNTLPDFPSPEISTAPIEGVVLILKYMGINKVANFPFPTPPDKTALVDSERCLNTLGALDQTTGRLMPVGEAMSLYPISPRHSRMLLTVIQILKERDECAGASLVLAFAMAVAAALSVDNPFLIHFSSVAGKDTKDKQRGKDTAVDKETEKQEHLEIKKQRAMAKAAYKMFENISSDALTVASALRSYELADNPEQFCRLNSLHLKTMDEMSKLRKQLLRLVFNQEMQKKQKEDFTWTFGNLADVEFAWRESINKSLTSTQEDILGQAICAGWADRVARRLRPLEGQRTRAVKYQACFVEEIVFLHSLSSVAKLAPEFVAYNDLIQTIRPHMNDEAKPYMNGVTCIKSTWLALHARALCTFSKPFEDPRPYYDCLSDQVFCWVSPTFGPHLWELPLDRSIMKNINHRTAVFACALLQGKVLPCLKEFQQFLAADPSMVLKPEAKAHKRVSDLLHRLSVGPVVDSRIKLKSAWDADQKFLYVEILAWIQGKFHHLFDQLWKQMQHESQLDCKQLFHKIIKKLSSKKEIKDW
ncbi:hypothetical protein SUGI_0091870 [Cryptomeria japonica]|uniref:ATP-dependent RNA helicase DEAH13 n=1 Tax=Cryptomeria japonica TaxID=3369 RepID=UPI002408BE5A|nr:ATP-dependent RNA helicase DEAH13 [Cryptomeria japonica]GLJ08592.1 hypothetical protein SUGI_0091870 [Cryptomeria japonica]